MDQTPPTPVLPNLPAFLVAGRYFDHKVEPGSQIRGVTAVIVAQDDTMALDMLLKRYPKLNPAKSFARKIEENEPKIIFEA